VAEAVAWGSGALLWVGSEEADGAGAEGGTDACVDPAPASGADSTLADAWLAVVLKPSFGRIRKDTSPMARAAIPTARMGHSRTRDGAEAVRWTPCRDAASGTLSNSSRAYLVMVEGHPC
jgi:hypothetical protein